MYYNIVLSWAPRRKGGYEVGGPFLRKWHFTTSRHVDVYLRGRRRHCVRCCVSSSKPLSPASAHIPPTQLILSPLATSTRSFSDFIYTFKHTHKHTHNHTHKHWYTYYYYYYTQTLTHTEKTQNSSTCSLNVRTCKRNNMTAKREWWGARGRWIKKAFDGVRAGLMKLVAQGWLILGDPNLTKNMFLYVPKCHI